MQQAGRQRSNSERLQFLVATPMPAFNERMMKYIKPKIDYMNNKHEVVISAHFEFYYIAYVKPEAFKMQELINYFTELIEKGQLPKAVATTLFMIYGKIYAHELKPPIIMAKLLYYDLMGAQEFVYFERAADFIRRVQLTYFIEPSILSPQTKLFLYKHKSPDATEAPETYLSNWEEKERRTIAEVQHLASNAIQKISTEHVTDHHYIDALVTFLTVPDGRETFIKEFAFISTTFPYYIPRLFQASLFFLASVKPEDNRAAEFMHNFVRLNPQICVDEYQNTLTALSNVSPLFSSIIYNSQLTRSVQKEDDKIESLIKTLVESPIEQFNEILAALNEKSAQNNPPFAYTFDILSKFLCSAHPSIEGVSRVVQMFWSFLKNTKYDSDYSRLCDLIFSFVDYITKIQPIENMIKFISNIILPPSLRKEGLPFRQDTLLPFVSHQECHQTAYQMICAAAKYQYFKNLPAVLGPSKSREIAEQIQCFCLSNQLIVCARSFVLGCLLIIISPSDIGAQIYCKEEHLINIFRSFLRSFLERSTDSNLLEEDISFSHDSDLVKDPAEAKKFILQFANIKYLSPSSLLRCRTPNYVDDLLLNEKMFPPPKYIINMPSDILETTSYFAISKYIFACLINIVMTDNFIHISDIYRMGQVSNWLRLLGLKNVDNQEKEERSKYYAKYLENPKRPMRVAAYVLITLINYDRRSKSESINKLDSDLMELSFNFNLPNTPEIIDIISRSLYIDNEVEIIKAFIQYLYSVDASNALEEFVFKRPLLANCLQEPSLTKLIDHKVSYDIDYPPNYKMPQFPHLLPKQTNPRFHYHEYKVNHPKVIDINTLPYEPPPTIEPLTSALNSKFEIQSFETSKMELEIYRYEMTLYSAKSDDPSRWFALASLKRYVLKNDRAFLLYAKPTLEVLYNEFGHASFITKDMLSRLLAFLVVCQIRLNLKQGSLSDEENLFIKTNLLPKLKDISEFEQFEQYGSDMPLLIPALINNILEIHTDQNGIASFILPSEISWDLMVSNNLMIDAFLRSLMISTEEYASKWLFKASFAVNLNLDDTELQDSVLIPLILSSSKNAVNDFFRITREMNSASSNALSHKITSIVTALYITRQQQNPPPPPTQAQSQSQVQTQVQIPVQQHQQQLPIQPSYPIQK
ncbi:hypothetical protein TRFO_02396 [Tritrichomonas foetus]|uniref:Uncharacterized protein n=1 Tax=Tritrichomonas foetus TaxID=1144522 RepID=A0A1J4J366_9EUKA|nr:hypothetical protein TRFO_02396 [Tritrichomonas foetus]|eukprot:OHS93862.1 hypothetical protein TRFO_02396 [Tritrichomonas foetus]